MDGLHVPTAAPWKQRFGGEEFWMEPLTLKDWAILEKRYLESRPDPIELAKARLDGCDAQKRRELLESALQTAMQGSRATLGELKRFLRTREGLSLMLWLALRRRHPQMTEARAHELLMTLRSEQVNRLQTNVQAAGTGEDPSKN